MNETYAILGFLSGGRTTLRESGTHDTDYGKAGKTVRTPHVLRMIKDGVLLSGAATMAELNKPQWGNGSQTMEEILPVLPAKVPKFLPSGFWDWHPYDPSNPPTQDPFEIWSGLTGNAMYWELEGDQVGKYFQGAGNSVHIKDVNGNLVVWNILGIQRYRRMKQGTEPSFIPNPQFPIVEAEREEKKAQFEAIIRATLVPVGHYQFRGLPTGDDPRRTDPNKFGYGWRINGEDIPVDPTHRLAIPAWGWKFLPAPMRNPENHAYKGRDSRTGVVTTIVVDLYEQTFETALKNALDVTPHNKRMKTLLSL